MSGWPVTLARGLLRPYIMSSWNLVFTHTVLIFYFIVVTYFCVYYLHLRGVCKDHAIRMPCITLFTNSFNTLIIFPTTQRKLIISGRKEEELFKRTVFLPSSFFRTFQWSVCSILFVVDSTTSVSRLSLFPASPGTLLVPPHTGQPSDGNNTDQQCKKKAWRKTVGKIGDFSVWEQPTRRKRGRSKKRKNYSTLDIQRGIIRTGGYLRVNAGYIMLDRVRTDDIREWRACYTSQAVYVYYQQLQKQLVWTFGEHDPHPLVSEYTTGRHNGSRATM